jgi:hypothetical protein
MPENNQIVLSQVLKENINVLSNSWVKEEIHAISLKRTTIHKIFFLNGLLKMLKML